mgnify:CR=1 FL=1|jgi:uncharacterized OB-fold protein
MQENKDRFILKKRGIMMSKYCEQCGTELDDDELFCNKCGAKCSTEFPEENIDIQSHHKIPKNRRKKRKTLKVILAIVFVILVVSIVGSGKIKKAIADFKEGYQEQEKINAKEDSAGNADTDKDAGNKTSQEDKKLETDDTKQKQSDTVAMDYTQYIGKWINISGTVDDVYQHGGVLLEINSIENKTMTFSITHVSTNAAYIAIADDITATIEDDRVDFTYYDSFENAGEGTLLLKGDSVVAVLSDTTPGEGAMYSVATNVTLSKYKAGAASNSAERDYTASNYIFPDSDKSYLVQNDLWTYDLDTLELGRNEIFARHGRIFNDEKISSYFESQAWYNGTISPDEFDSNMGSMLNGYEKTNIQTIKEVETVKSQRGNP